MTVERRIDAVPVIAPHPSSDPLRRRLDDLLTRCFYSGAGYVFESDPHVVTEDGPLLAALAGIRQEDRRHAHVLASLIQARGGVPQPGVFPWWNQDLNYLTVPTVARFVLGSMQEEAGHYTELVAAWPGDDPGGLAALSSVRADKVRQVAALAPIVYEAERREAETYKAQIAAVKKTRDARIAKEKAAADAARKAKMAGKAGAPAAAKPAVAAAPVAALLDPKEPGISPKERARRTIARFRAAGHGPAPVAGVPAAAAAASPATPAAAAVAAGADLPDPNEAGISPKEKAKRQIAITRAKAAGGAPAAPAPAPVAAPAVELPDPSEPGISPKEKAKRQIAITRAKAAGGAPAGAPAPAPVAAPAVELPDPSEPGISPKEKAKRQIAITRAKAAGGAPAAPATAASVPAGAAPAAPPVPAPAVAPAAPVVEDLGDPDEPGLSPKEKARRKVARMRANRA